MKFLAGYHTDNGIRKKENQDALLIKTASSPYGRIGLFAVSDGMGGLSCGELASASVVEGLRKWFDEEIGTINFKNIDDDTIYSMINDRILNLNYKILQYGLSRNEKLGTTLTMMLIVNNKGYVFQVGDSRAYRIKDGIQQLTVDQSFVQREIERGNLTQEEALTHPKKSVLLQCIGAKKNVSVKMDSIEIQSGEVYLICSDGFYRRLKSEEIMNNLKWKQQDSFNGISNTVKELCELVKQRKEQDNITAIVIKII